MVRRARRRPGKRSVPDLKRRGPRLEPRRRFVLFLEGSRTEPTRELGLSPRSRRRKDSFEEQDRVWAVFDRDEHPRFDEAVALCRAHGIGVGRSNPCFELWLILHERDYDRPNERHAMQAELKALRPEYDAGGAKTPDCDDLMARIEDAERRGEEQLRRREDEDNPFGNPSTTVGRLTAAIREAAELAP